MKKYWKHLCGEPFAYENSSLHSPRYLPFPYIFFFIFICWFNSLIMGRVFILSVPFVRLVHSYGMLNPSTSKCPLLILLPEIISFVRVIANGEMDRQDGSLALRAAKYACVWMSVNNNFQENEKHIKDRQISKKRASCGPSDFMLCWPLHRPGRPSPLVRTPEDDGQWVQSVCYDYGYNGISSAVRVRCKIVDIKQCNVAC